MKEFGWDDSLGFTIKKNAMYQDQIFGDDRMWKIMDFFIHKSSTKERVARTKYGDVSLKRGQFLFSYRHFAKILGVHVPTLFRHVKWLKIHGYLEIEDHGKYSVISLNLSMLYDGSVNVNSTWNTSGTVKETIKDEVEVVDPKWIYDFDENKFVFEDLPKVELDNNKDNITTNNTSSIIVGETPKDSPSDPPPKVGGSKKILFHFLSSWTKKYKARYPADYKRDGFIAKKILSLAESEERAIEMIDAYLSDSDRYVVNQKHPFKTLLANAPRYAVLLSNSHPAQAVPVDNTPGSGYIDFDEAYAEAHTPELLKYFYELWERTFSNPYPFDKTNDEKAAKIILSKYGLGRANRLMLFYFEWTERSVESAGHPIQLLVQNMDRIDEEIKAWER